MSQFSLPPGFEPIAPPVIRRTIRTRRTRRHDWRPVQLLLSIVAGGALPPSSLHTWYVTMEVVKLLGLLAIGITALVRGPRRG